MYKENTMRNSGQLTGVGVGPGDPELLTLKAARLIREADVLCYLTGESGQSQARNIAAAVIAERVSPAREISILMPMSTDRRAANAAYDQAADTLAGCLSDGLQVVFLCEGDPLFFGSFSYLLERLQTHYPCQVVPGISSVNAAASALQQALTLQRESFAVVSGRHSDAQILSALNEHDSVVIMKAGQARPRILQLLRQCGRLQDARYLENIGRENQVVHTNVGLLMAQAGPYFSLFVVTRSQCRTA